MSMTLEKRVLYEIINMYKDSPCLWDNRQVLYSNKEARDQAYEVLLETYRQLHEDAGMIDLKRRIENMRCSYRREHKKVLLSRLKGDDPEYTPQLWYYDSLTFLNDVMNFDQLEPVPRTENLDQDSSHIEIDDSILRSHLLKKRKLSENTIYIQENQDSDEFDEEINETDVLSNNQDNNRISNSTLNGVTEPEAFGTTIGLQLKELDHGQRVIAEKLISDVMFHARLHKLSYTSSLNI